MKIGIFGGATNGTIDDMVGEATQAERDGFASYWVSQIFGHDALTVLALIGRSVPRIELGTSVVPTYPRHPMMIAQQSHTVNAAINGRQVSFTGEVYSTHAELAIAGATPFGIVVAALGEQMLRVTAAMADGTLTWCTGPETLASHTVPAIRAAAEEFGRPAPRVIAALPVCVTKDVAGARERAAQVFAIYGQLPSYRAMLDHEGVAGPADIAIFGTKAEVEVRVLALDAIGVTDFAAVEFGATADEIGDTRAVLKSLL